jgi:uncharacterized protein YjiK
MKSRNYRILFILSVILQSFTFFYCQQINVNSLLGRYNLTGEKNKYINLEKNLNEISGLVDAGDNFIFTHNDEKAIIFKLDLSTGKTVSHFSLGEKPLEGDFEGIALVNDSIYLAGSNGSLYKFIEGKKGQSVKYELINTGLNEGNDIEGLCYDPDRKSLLLTCKDVTKKKFKHFRTVYEYNLLTKTLSTNPRFLIPLQTLKGKFNIKEFAPSGIERHPLTGNFFIISANEPSVIEISPDGIILNAIKLKDKDHRQTEGITIMKDNNLILSDEAKGKKAKLTIIPFE